MNARLGVKSSPSVSLRAPDKSGRPRLKTEGFSFLFNSNLSAEGAKESLIALIKNLASNRSRRVIQSSQTPLNWNVKVYFLLGGLSRGLIVKGHTRGYVSLA